MANDQPPAVGYNLPPNQLQNRQSMEAEKVRVDRFGLRFDGNERNMSIEDFIFRLEYLQSRYRIPWMEIVRDFHILMTGSASNWYWLYINNNPEAGWVDLRQALMQHYRTRRSHLEVSHDKNLSLQPNRRVFVSSRKNLIFLH